MAASPQFVKITNNCEKRIVIHTRFPRPKKPGKKQSKPLERAIVLAPGESSRVIALPALIGAKNWDALRDRDCVHMKSAPWTPQFVRVTAIRETVEFDIKVPGRKSKHIRVVKGGTSRTLPLSAIPQHRKLESLARKRRALLERSYIGPTFSPGAVGSLGGDDVYICHECGGPIVFRGYPPRPIHV